MNIQNNNTFTSIDIRNQQLGWSSRKRIKTSIHIAEDGTVKSTKRLLGDEIVFMNIVGQCNIDPVRDFFSLVGDATLTLTIDTDVWIGNITNYPIQFKETIKDNYDFTLEFQGVKQ